jgi:hypothetical protein
MRSALMTVTVDGGVSELQAAVWKSKQASSAAATGVVPRKDLMMAFKAGFPFELIVDC